ncbi:MT12B-like protein [Mya arenaria]|uniref:MT12B-like protein n=1 Tax=Mya arenaria TaxID=6604 RepID=A0ABY7F7H2_MYAAR|nr:MT12B-like protein [Mya arenaria]
MKSSRKREDCGYGWVVVAAAFAINFLVDGLQFSSGVGTFVFNHVMYVLISEFTWRGAVLVAAGTALNGAVFGLLLRPAPGGDPSKAAVSTDGKTVKISAFGRIPFRAAELEEKSKTVNNPVERNTVVAALPTRDLLKDSRLLLFMAFSFMISLAFIIPFSFVPDEAVNAGMSKQQATWLMSSIGISNTVSRILIGWIGDKNCVNRPVMLVAVVALAGLSIAAVPFLPTFAAKLFIVTAVGFFLGGFMMLFAVVLADMFGDEVLTRSIGLSYFTIGLACFVAGPKGGWLFDMTGNYKATFLVAGSECLLAAALLASAISLHRKSYVMESVRDLSGKSGGLKSQGKVFCVDKAAKSSQITFM